MTEIIPRRFIHACLVTLIPSGPLWAQADEFFARAEDLSPGQAWTTNGHTHGGYQALGYDLEVMQWDDEAQDWQNCWLDGLPSACARNEVFLVWEKPVFASAGGRVVRCSRNAPDNPSVGPNHPEFERMMAGGNFLFIEEPDGELILYAHFRRGTIPERLCPRSPDPDFPLAASAITPGEFADDALGDLPATNQPTVEAGSAEPT